MRIAIDSIPADGRQIHADLGHPWAAQAAQGALDATPSALGADLRFERRGPAVFVVGTVTVETTAECDRCGEPVALSLSHEVELAYVAEEQSAHGEVELGAGDLDVGWFSGDAIEAGDVLSEAIALALPSRITCTDTEACDARTGAMLAEAAGDAPPGHPAFAALRARFGDA